MPDTSSVAPYAPWTPHAIGDRAYWTKVQEDPRYRRLLNKTEELCHDAPPKPSMPSASDFLAARRANERGRLDGHWQVRRGTFSALALRRCLLGLQPDDPDDRLLDWLWAFMTEPTWVVSAHLPGNDLPVGGTPVLDLASCEMAALLAEMRECLKPWMDSVSGTLAATLLGEIDERILMPYARGVEVAWQPSAGHHLNNWTGVCCGSILATCESLAAQGYPRPKAKERALQGLRLFLKHSFTEHGECDEGMGYWNYGLGFACLGWSRLARGELISQVDRERLCAVADYPRRCHLFEDAFFSGNDGGLHAQAPLYFVPWLSAVTDSAFLKDWAAQAPSLDIRHFGMLWRGLKAVETVATDSSARVVQSKIHGSTELTAGNPKSKIETAFLEDQQVAILKMQTPKGDLLACLTGGHNSERHNHNDLGHFMVALNGRFIVPDLGRPQYRSDFFGPKRYTYLSASSRGHCCPLIGEAEQWPGAQAAAKVLSWRPTAEIPQLVLDLTAAYPPEAGLLFWTRSLEAWPGNAHEPARMVILDQFRTREPGQRITHVLWSTETPHEKSQEVSAHGLVCMKLGPLLCEFSPASNAIGVTAFEAEKLLLVDMPATTLYRIEAVYRSNEEGKLGIETRFMAG